MRTRAPESRRTAAPARLAAAGIALAAVAWQAVAGAATLAVRVLRPGGEPLAGAVVLLHGPAGTPRPHPESVVVDQVNQAFVPDLTIVPVGSSVTFPNSDRVSHQVYSFSPAKKFQLPLYRGAPYPPLKLDVAGIITLGCNIHDDMIAYLVVTEAEWFGRTGAGGTWNAAELPAGDFRVEVWHPRMREATATLERTVRLEAAQSASLDVRLDREPRPAPLGGKPRSWNDY